MRKVLAVAGSVYLTWEIFMRSMEVFFQVEGGSGWEVFAGIIGFLVALRVGLWVGDKIKT